MNFDFAYSSVASTFGLLRWPCFFCNSSVRSRERVLFQPDGSFLDMTSGMYSSIEREAVANNGDTLM